MEHKSFKDFNRASYSVDKSKDDLYCVDITSGTESLRSNTRPTTRYRDRSCLLKCHLCLHRRHTFFCPDCIEKGNFTHSTTKNLERFADKKVKYYYILQTKTELCSQISDVLLRKAQLLELKQEISCRVEQINLLRKGIEEVKEKKAKDAKAVESLHEEIQELGNQMEQRRSRLQKIGKSKHICQENVEQKQRDLTDAVNTLQVLRRDHIAMLNTHIFPICKIEHNGSSEETLDSSESSSSNDSYLLVPFQNREESHYRILESVLPSSGDYSQYHEWLSSRKDTGILPGSCSTSSSVHLASSSRLTQVSPESLRNTAYCISSALAHAAQLVAALAFILDIRLPKSLCYSEFCGNELSRDQFAFRVGKLNANVVYLCLSQGLKPSLIDNHKATLKNLSLLFQLMPDKLGRCSPISVEGHLPESWPYGGEDEFTDLSFDDFLEEESSSGTSGLSHQDSQHEQDEEGWESVPDCLPSDPFICTVPTRGSTSATTSVQSQSQARSVLTQTTDTTGGGLMSSVASLWRAIGGQK